MRPLDDVTEVDALRDQRDLYRALVVINRTRVRQFVTSALKLIEQARTLMRQSARDNASFRARNRALLDVLKAMHTQLGDMDIAPIRERMDRAIGQLVQLNARPQCSGNDLLPALAAIESLANLLHLVADDVLFENPPEAAVVQTARPALPATTGVVAASADIELMPALNGLVARTAFDLGKAVLVRATGLEQVPAPSRSNFFDLIAPLLQRAIEHDIEPVDQRLSCGKPECGQITITVRPAGSGLEVDIEDDGCGVEPFSANTTSANVDADAGLAEVRQLLAPLGGHLSVAMQPAAFTRLRVFLPQNLPSLEITDERFARLDTARA